MSGANTDRPLTLPEELERLEQSITLTLQEIDSNFSLAHRIVTGSILPIVADYTKHSVNVWEGSKFWKQFFEASANVSLSGYEEDNQESTVMPEDTNGAGNDDSHGNLDPDAPTELLDDDHYGLNGEDLILESPSQMIGHHGTPKPRAENDKTPRQTARQDSRAGRSVSNAPSTPRAQAEPHTPVGRFVPQVSTFQHDTSSRTDDPVLHRVLDKTYRVQATPLAPDRKLEAPTAVTPVRIGNERFWDNSPGSSPEIAIPQLRTELFSPQTQSQDFPHETASSSIAYDKHLQWQSNEYQRTIRQSKHSPFRTSGVNSRNDVDENETEDDLLYGASPPKTMQFYIPQSRLVQTPAREASKRIVGDLLFSAGFEDTDDLDEEQLDASPSVVRNDLDLVGDAF